ncbi:hypothetical protein FGADI_11887 [Fusarium gaditjirri]|uniref:Uncharacterized protein n=1 Tax=Fusarium gaditjirri TaxID=282569 RepID=A0A8H4SU07_9HYPO|nr:hypothetical protein FGADI_11887 [Fusarium gaditjirri]
MCIKRKGDASVNTKIREFDWIGTIIFVRSLKSFLIPLSWAPAAVIVGVLIAKTGTYRPFIWTGWALVTIGMGLMLLLDNHTETFRWVLIYLTGGVGLGILYSAQAFAAQASASNCDLPFAASFYAFFRSLSQGIGVSVGGVTFQNEFRKQVEKSPESGSKANEWAKDASALVQILEKSPYRTQSMKDTIIDAYINGLRTVWLVLTLLACIALLVSLVCVKAKSLDRKFETEHTLDQAFPKDKKGQRVPEVNVDRIWDLFRYVSPVVLEHCFLNNAE